METLASVCFVLLYFTMGLYFIEVMLLTLFPKIELCQDIPYTKHSKITFFIVIPCLNEEGVIGKTVKRMLDLDVPGVRLIVIDDHSSDGTIAALEAVACAVHINADTINLDAYRGERLILLKRRLPEAQKGKGAALNNAYSLISRIISSEDLDPNKCVVSVFDADVQINARMLERVAVIMSNRPEIGMVQSRVRIDAHTRNFFLARMQDFEFFIQINRQQNMREYMSTVAAAGNGQFNRFSAIDPHLPWTACLLEDFDFSTRLLLKGWHTSLLQSEWVYQQGVLDYRAFLKQRARWCQGGIQCFHFFQDIWHSSHLPLSGKLELTFFLFCSCVTMLSLIALALCAIACIYFALVRENLTAQMFMPFSTGKLYAAFITILFFAFSPGLLYGIWYYKDAKDENLLICVLTGLFNPIYNMLQAPAVIIAIFRQLTGKRNWIKTKH
ncbi:MAG: glycosyltransferase family 2 protein [Clostridia bacterium]|nr:glycosyltransferase family 2 protein [Clostridia bacterium]